jgi:tetratricopeptide (TPR) repeat protein
MRYALPLLMLLAACAHDPQLLQWDADFYYTEKLYVDGQHDLAVARYKALAQHAKSPRDADEAGLMACEVDARRHKFAEAATCYEAVASDGQDRGVRIRALMHASELRYYELNQQQDALDMWIVICRVAPDEAASQRALDHLYKHGQADKVARESMERLFEKLHDRDPTGELADNYLLRGAMLRDEEGTPDALDRAVVLLTKLETNFPEAQTLPDAWILHTNILHKQGKFAEEAVLLERVIETFETSHIFASYALEAHKDAASRLVDLYRGTLHNLERAELHARHLPEMLHHPVKIYAYLWTVEQIQEERGHWSDALATCQEILHTELEKRDDMAENDKRICDESETPEMKERCFADLASHPAIEPKEVPMAKAKILELQAKLQSAPRSTP